MDELLEQMEADELEDRLDHQTLATPIDYGRMRGIVPQKVYYRIRTGILPTKTCPCGRRVVDIEEADKLFRKGNYDGNRRDVEAVGDAEEHEDEEP